MAGDMGGLPMGEIPGAVAAGLVAGSICGEVAGDMAGGCARVASASVKVQKQMVSDVFIFKDGLETGSIRKQVLSIYLWQVSSSRVEEKL
jgi:hypothetical protein